MMRRYSLTARRVILAIASTLIASLGVAASASAIVLNDSGTQAGVALVPSARGGGDLANVSLPSGVTADSTTGSCTDPWLSSDLGGPTLPQDALCYRGGPVMHKNETFALTWDAPLPSGSERNYWEQTRGYVEQFLRDVADSSGSLNSPFAVATQYQDGGGRAQNASVFGGGCIDYGVAGSSSCEYGSPTGAGHDFPTGGCNPALGDSFVAPDTAVGNSLCLTDAQIQSEVSTMVTQTGILGRTQPGYTPLVTLLLPAGVETCLDSNHKLCSANASLTAPQPTVTSSATGGNLVAGTYQVEVTYVTSNGEQLPSAPASITTTGTTSTITIDSPPAGTGVTGWYAYVTQPGGYTYTRQQGEQTIGTALTLNGLGGGAAPPSSAAFCSYHSEVNVGGTEVAYVVQPWTPLTGCDEPDAPVFPEDPTPEQASVDVGARLVSPLSQSELAAITNPGLNGWMGLDGWEIDDNAGCAPEPNQLDSETLGSSSQNPYFLQREFNNAGALEFDPWTYYGCAPLVDLIPAFVVPSAIDQGDEVELDGSATESTLIVPNAGYSWNFGDGSSATGPSVVHTYSKAGTYNVTLTTTDRGGNVATLTQTIQVLGSTGQPVLAPTTAGSGSGSGSGSAAGSALSVHLQLLPQSLKGVLRSGIAVQVSSNKAADGIATVSITRAAAKRAHIRFGKKARAVRIGIGTVSSVTNGTVTLRLHLSKSIAKKLAHLGHVDLTVRLALVASGNQQVAIDAAGKY